MTKVAKELIYKTIAFILVVVILIVINDKCGLYDAMKDISARISNPSANPLNGGDWALLFGYRFCVYFALPILVTAFEFIFFKNRRHFCWAILNCEAHFIALSLVCGCYYIFGFDYILGGRIFTIGQSVSSFMLLLFTILLSRKFPHVIMKDEKKMFPEENKGENK